MTFTCQLLLTTSTQDDTVDEEDLEDDEGAQDETELWEVTHVSDQELEATEDESVDFLVELLCPMGWPQVNDNETEKDFFCLLWIDQARAKDKTYIWVSVRWKTKN